MKFSLLIVHSENFARVIEDSIVRPLLILVEKQIDKVDINVPNEYIQQSNIDVNRQSVRINCLINKIPSYSQTP